MEPQVICGYCDDELDSEEALDDHLRHTCPRSPLWFVRRIGLEREGWDVPRDAA